MGGIEDVCSMEDRVAKLDVTLSFVHDVISHATQMISRILSVLARHQE
jgi:hypothetical protein